MSYVNVEDDNVLQDIHTRKEFHMLAHEHKHKSDSNIIPYFMLKKEMDRGRYLRLRSYQLFVRNFMSPDTPYSRLLVMHGMGTGKTASGISIAMEYIKYFKQQSRGSGHQPFVYIIGFTRAQFERDLFRFSEFGFISRAEQQQLKKLKKYSRTGSEADVTAYKDFQIKLRRRLGNQKNNGFFRFIGYRELANHIFISNKNVTKMSEAEINSGIADGSLVIDEEYVAKFKNCLIICDEIHNVYNSLAKNNWGVAIQILLDMHACNIRAVFMSGTVMKNSQTEIIDVLNLIAGSKEKKYVHDDFFDSNNNLKPGALDNISNVSRGRVSFLVDVNPSRYPSYSYEGEKLKGAKYLSFVRTKMSPIQDKTYRSVEDNKAHLHEHSYIFDMVFPNPKDDLGIFKSAQLRSLQSAKDTWLAKKGMHIDQKTHTISGDILSKDAISEYSGKYPKMLDILDEKRATGDGKTFIYHKFVHMTGVYMVGNLLSANGYLSLNAPVGDQTKCSLCKHTMKSHPKKGEHKFAAARYILVHGEINKKTVSNLLDVYNSADNIDGSKIMIVVGSRVMREAYDLNSVRNEIIVSRPDNIPSLLQITARAIRAGSHQQLSANKRHVNIYILTASLADGSLSYEEDKYVQKVNDYTIIQLIVRAINKTALDAVINRGAIEPALVKDDIGHLYFDPEIKVQDHLRPEDMNLSTFNVFYKEREVVDIIYIIKRLFMGHSRVWNASDLWDAVKAPPFDFEYNCALFDHNSFIIALERIVWNNDHFTDIDNEKNANILDILQDESDKRIMIAGYAIGVIVQVEDFYIAVPMNAITMMPDLYVDSPFRMKESGCGTIVDVTSYTQSILSSRRFDDLKIKFMNKYKGKPVTEMTDAICLHGPDFHIMLVEEIISYIFDLWTNPKIVASKEFNAFYFQMLYYYDVLGIVVWLNSARNFIRDIYSDFDSVIKQNDSSTNLLPKKYENKNRGNIIHIARAIERSGCAWCPNTTKTRYDHAIMKSKERFTKLTSGKLSATDDIIPIGHFIDSIPRFYHPDRQWFSSPEYIHSDVEWKENNIIVGFDTRSEGGLHIRFRLRNPKHKLKHHKDSRLTERGIICTSRSKPYLLDLCKKLGIKTVSSKNNVSAICKEVRARLMYLELNERAKNTNIKWYYNQFEDGAGLT
jgi:hypothetical protein